MMPVSDAYCPSVRHSYSMFNSETTIINIVGIIYINLFLIGRFPFSDQLSMYNWHSASARTIILSWMTSLPVFVNLAIGFLINFNFIQVLSTQKGM